MTEKTHDKEMDALKADIASLREDLALLASGLKKYVGARAAEARDEEALAEAEQEGHDADAQDPGIFADILHKFSSSRAQGEKVVKGLAAEVEQYPLVSIMAAFGLGYIIGKLWYQENKE